MCHRVSPCVLLTAHMFLDVTKVTHSTLAALSQSVNLPPADTTNIPKCISKWRCRGMENKTLFQDFNRYLSKIFHLVRSDKYHHLHLQKVILHTDIVIDSVFNSWLKCLCLENSGGHKYSGMVNFGWKTFSDFVVLFKLGLFRAIGNNFKMGQHKEVHVFNSYNLRKWERLKVKTKYLQYFSRSVVGLFGRGWVVLNFW